jgi:DNA-binding GntR family transcriptional regulator
MDFQGLFRNLTYRDQAQEAIRHLIFTGTYKPGQRLKEAEISQKLGISRAPVREAIQTLANDGLIELVPHKGAIVANFDAWEVRQLYEVREALEVMAARLAAERASVQQLEKLQKLLETTTTVIEGSESTSYPRDLDFHRGVLELAGNPKLEKQASEIHAQMQLVRLWSGSRPGRASESYEEHVAVFEALREKDPEEAERAMRNHISNGLKNMMEILATKDTGAARGLVRSTGGSA